MRLGAWVVERERGACSDSVEFSWASWSRARGEAAFFAVGISVGIFVVLLILVALGIVVLVVLFLIVLVVLVRVGVLHDFVF